MYLLKIYKKVKRILVCGRNVILISNSEIKGEKKKTRKKFSIERKRGESRTQKRKLSIYIPLSNFEPLTWKS